MSRGLYDRCTCGHTHPEHSLFGTCRACLDCGEVFDEDDDHPYRQCECRAFDPVPEDDPVVYVIRDR
ncbi:hypothetical protein [Mycolicibacterium lacusdiani]|uniref:hypothetical protein n=1 Tax=Mycolicibacterium lacusdiani TaxID=2895283 RepID=UPI001F368345|nr:hypothetical protein [Mycolicibacterium lacusdiani]